MFFFKTTKTSRHGSGLADRIPCSKSTLFKICESRTQISVRALVSIRLIFKRDCSYFNTIEFFTVYTKLAEMAILASNYLTTKKKLPPVGLDLMQGIITGLWVQHQTNWATEAFACKTETLGSLYSHALLILTKWSEVSSKCLCGSVGLVLDS